MQNETQTTDATITPEASAIDPSVQAHADQLAAEATAAAQAKQATAEANRAKRASRPSASPAKRSSPATANGKAAAKRVASKPAKPTQAEREAAQRAQADGRRLAREAAAKAVAEFYAGASKPFKAASDRFADLNPANGKAPSSRQAGLLLALITYGGGNMRGDGTFTRGAFTVPARLVNANAKPGDTVKAQPESGCLGNMLGRAVDYVSGPRSGREQAQAVFRIRVPVALREIQAAFGDKQAANAKRLLAAYGKRAA